MPLKTSTNILFGTHHSKYGKMRYFSFITILFHTYQVRLIFVKQWFNGHLAVCVFFLPKYILNVLKGRLCFDEYVTRVYYKMSTFLRLRFYALLVYEMVGVSFLNFTALKSNKSDGPENLKLGKWTSWGKKQNFLQNFTTHGNLSLAIGDE